MFARKSPEGGDRPKDSNNAATGPIPSNGTRNLKGYNEAARMIMMDEARAISDFI